jgi:hypothetical protein
MAAVCSRVAASRSSCEDTAHQAEISRGAAISSGYSVTCTVPARRSACHFMTQSTRLVSANFSNSQLVLSNASRRLGSMCSDLYCLPLLRPKYRGEETLGLIGLLQKIAGPTRASIRQLKPRRAAITLGRSGWCYTPVAFAGGWVE